MAEATPKLRAARRAQRHLEMRRSPILRGRGVYRREGKVKQGAVPGLGLMVAVVEMMAVRFISGHYRGHGNIRSLLQGAPHGFLRVRTHQHPHPSLYSCCARRT